MHDHEQPQNHNGVEDVVVPLSSSITPAAERQDDRNEAIPVDQIEARPRSGGQPPGSRTYEEYEVIFRRHHATDSIRRRGPYELFRLVYRYGYELGIDARYASAEWARVEQDARPRWEERNPGTWDEFKDMIRYAWNTCRFWPHD